MINCSLILGICLLVILALYIPQYYNSLYDFKLENKISYEDTELMAYETHYDSFYNKLYAVALCKNKDIGLKSIKINEYDSSFNNDKLTEIIQRELDKLCDENTFLKSIEVLKDKLASRELYTLYAVKGNKEFKGINYYKVVYEIEECKITIYLDSEYHKIYDITIEIQDKNLSVKNYIKDMENTEVYIADKILYMKNGYILSYFGLENCSWSYPYNTAEYYDGKVKEKDYDDSCIIVDMDEDCQLYIKQRTWLDIDKKYYWEMGIGVKEYLD